MGIRKKPHGVVIKPLRKRIRPRHTGPALLKMHARAAAAQTPAPTSSMAVVGVRELQLARALSDTEAEARDAALAALQAWLAEHGADLSALDMDRLCKALFYCVWMADGRVVIAEVVAKVVALGDVGGWPFLQALMKCVVREWHGVDRHRVDKYYELVTACVESCVVRAVREAADASVGVSGAVDRLMKVLDGEVVSQTGKGASGVALHVLDYWNERVLAPVIGFAKGVLQQNDLVVAFDSVMTPVYGVLGAKSGSGMAVSRRSVERVLNELPNAVEGLGVSDKGRRDMCRRVMRKVWVAAADKSTLEECRERLYAVHAKLKSHVKQLEENVGVVPEKPRVEDRSGKQSADLEEMETEKPMEKSKAYEVVKMDVATEKTPSKRSKRSARNHRKV